MKSEPRWCFLEPAADEQSRRHVLNYPEAVFGRADRHRLLCRELPAASAAENSGGR